MGLGVSPAEVESGDSLRHPAVAEGGEEESLAPRRIQSVEEGLVVEMEGRVPGDADPDSGRIPHHGCASGNPFFRLVCPGFPDKEVRPAAPAFRRSGRLNCV